jgi:Dna[CI] antecedent, DciA
MAGQEPKPFSRLAETLIREFRRLPSDEPARMRRRPTHEMAALVDELKTRHQIGRSTPEDTIREHWAELVGPANASYSHAVAIDLRNRLTVHASHAVVRSELFVNREEIVSRIRKLPGCANVRFLNIRAG